MKTLLKVALLSAAMVLASCGGGDEKKSETSSPEATTSHPTGLSTSEEQTTSHPTGLSTDEKSDDSGEASKGSKSDVSGEGSKSEGSKSDVSSDVDEHSYVDFYVVGNFNGWKALDPEYQMWAPEELDEMGNIAVYHGLNLSWDDGLKVTTPDGTETKWIGVGATGDDNYVAPAKGVYSVYVYLDNGAPKLSVVLDEDSGEEKPTDAWWVVGSFNNWGNDGRYALEAVIDPVFDYLSDVHEFAANTELKVNNTAANKWISGDAAYAADEVTEWTVLDGGNVKVLDAGEYRVGLVDSGEGNYLVRLEMVA